jgi:hypothetical protein
MPRIRKTSTQPKRKPKKEFVIPEKIYPEYIQNFKNEVENKTPFKVMADQYSKDSAYHVGIIQKSGRTNRCIWMTSTANNIEDLKIFWSSKTYMDWKQNNKV